MSVDPHWLAFEKMIESKEVFDFYGHDNCAFKLGEAIFEAIEDPDDGYRSYLDTIKLKSSKGLIFFGQPIAQVQVTEFKSKSDLEKYAYEEFVGYALRDITDGHIWLKIGTDYRDDYYPCFVFSYQPKKPKQD